VRAAIEFAAFHSCSCFPARPRGLAAAGVAGRSPFNLERHLNHRDRFKENRTAALAEWRQLAA